MNIIVITQGVSPIVFPLIRSNHSIVGIIECSAKKKKRLKGFVWTGIKSIYTTMVNPNFSLRKVAKRHQIPYIQMKNGSDKQLEHWVSELEPDLIVVYSMSELLKENIYKLPKHGTINLHPSYLPEYRGPFPDFWIYYNMDLQPGVTVHYIDKGEDTGDIIKQRRYHLELGTRSPEMIAESIGKLGVDILLESIQSIEDGSVTRIVQPDQSPTPRARKIKRAEHKELIDWNSWPVEKVWHVLRGTETWLNALDQPKIIGMRWVIMGFDKHMDSNCTYGQIYKKMNQHFVACKDGRVFIQKKFRLKNILLYFARN